MAGANSHVQTKPETLVKIRNGNEIKHFTLYIEPRTKARMVLFLNVSYCQ